MDVTSFQPGALPVASVHVSAVITTSGKQAGITVIGSAGFAAGDGPYSGFGFHEGFYPFAGGR